MDVAHDALSDCLNSEREAVVLLLDADILDISCEELFDKAQKRFSRSYRSKLPTRFACIVVTPCLEALLLRISGKKAAPTSQSCKRIFKETFKKEAHQFTARDFENSFPRDVLETARATLPELDRLIQFFTLRGDSKEYDAWFSS